MPHEPKPESYEVWDLGLAELESSKSRGSGFLSYLAFIQTLEFLQDRITRFNFSESTVNASQPQKDTQTVPKSRR